MPSAAMAAGAAAQAAHKHWPWIIAAGAVGIMILLSPLLILVSLLQPQQGPTGKFPQQVERWRTLVAATAQQDGLSQYTDLFLAIIWQEVGTSDNPDIMQASESLGLPPNTLQDPAESVRAGIGHFAAVLHRAKQLGITDIAAVIQAYNFGSGYLDYVAAHGGKHTQQLADAYAALEAAAIGWGSYGDPQYASKVIAKWQANAGASASALPPATYAKLLQVAKQYLGMPYVWGGASPATSFDCSGLTQYVYGQVGIHLPRTAQEQWDATQHVDATQAAPGDLVFFTGTYDAGGDLITHVGIYLGNGQMLAADAPGVEITSITSTYWTQHLAGYGRVRA